MLNKFVVDRIGLIMIGAALLVILVIAGIVAMDSRDKRIEVIHKDGRSLSRLLSSIALEKLVRNESCLLYTSDAADE